MAGGRSTRIPHGLHSVHSFEPEVDGQRYTCIEPGRLFLYEAIDRSFQAHLTVDEDGLVVDYPTLFTRSQDLS